jgi:tRNA 2-thiocytidine biosynthesis protein TtcA
MSDTDLLPIHWVSSNSEVAQSFIEKAQLDTKVERKLLHYIRKAIADFNMIQTGDNVLVCLSGGKDSYTLLSLLNILRIRSNNKFKMHALTLDQGHPGWDDSGLRAYLDRTKIGYTIISKDTYSIVTDKIPENKTYCSLCSRLRRGNIYSFAKDNGFNKVALGHHKDDIIQTYLMSILYNGETKTMPPKLLTNDKKHIVIRPLAYCQEKDIAVYAKERDYPIIPCNLCGSQDNLSRQKVKKWIAELTADNSKIPSNILHACGSIRPSQLMDKELWDFKILDEQLINERI